MAKKGKSQGSSLASAKRSVNRVGRKVVRRVERAFEHMGEMVKKQTKTQPKPRNGQRVFVYGTLRKGGANHQRLDSAERVEKNVTLTGYVRRQRVGGPAIVKGRGTVRGEVYYVAPGTLSRVDQYEAPEFKRRLVTLDDGSQAWVYVYED